MAPTLGVFVCLSALQCLMEWPIPVSPGPRDFDDPAFVAVTLLVLAFRPFILLELVKLVLWSAPVAIVGEFPGVGERDRGWGWGSRSTESSPQSHPPMDEVKPPSRKERGDDHCPRTNVVDTYTMTSEVHSTENWTSSTRYSVAGSDTVYGKSPYARKSHIYVDDANVTCYSKRVTSNSERWASQYMHTRHDHCKNKSSSWSSKCQCGKDCNSEQAEKSRTQDAPRASEKEDRDCSEQKQPSRWRVACRASVAFVGDLISWGCFIRGFVFLATTMCEANTNRRR